MFFVEMRLNTPRIDVEVIKKFKWNILLFIGRSGRGSLIVKSSGGAYFVI